MIWSLVSLLRCNSLMKKQRSKTDTQAKPGAKLRCGEGEQFPPLIFLTSPISEPRSRYSYKDEILSLK
ncbi:hypothetical protein Peur_022875 [Populus x canadensis]